MIEQIRVNLNNPEILESLYQDDRKAFKEAFGKLYPEIENTDIAGFWKARLDNSKPQVKTGLFTFSDLIILLVVCVITAFLIKIPGIFNISYSDSIFYERNTAIIVAFGLTLFSILLDKTFRQKWIVIITLAFLIPVIYINILPADQTSHSINLAYIHLALLMWCIYGIVFTGFDLKNRGKRIDFIKYNGDLLIMYGLIAIAGGLLTAITIGLFEAIDIKIGKFYMENIVLSGAVCAPVVASFIIRNYPTLTNKLAPLIAGIFSPLVLLTLIIFLVTFAVTNKDPYNDRQFLLIFNIMLIGVMGIIVFSVSEASILKNRRFNEVILFILAIIAVIIDLIALSAIFYRLGDGITPNRLAVMMSNILILVNLVMIMIDLYRINFKKKEFRIVEMSVAKFLPVYLVWIIIVVFGFPLIFGMR